MQFGHLYDALGYKVDPCYVAAVRTHRLDVIALGVLDVDNESVADLVEVVVLAALIAVMMWHLDHPQSRSVVEVLTMQLSLLDAALRSHLWR